LSREERDRLSDIKEAIEAIKEHVERAARELPQPDDPLVRDALLYEFVVIGEAVKHLSADTRANAPQIPWEDIAGLRDLIAHEYFRIAMTRVREIIERDLPALETAVDELLGSR
jgi:uncharacterized protein with HEPN domain